MMDLAIIGAGRLGTSLGLALTKKGYRIAAISCRTRASARESAAILGLQEGFADNARAAARGEVLFLCLPDRVIPGEAEELARSGVEWKDKIVFHCSGLLLSEVLRPLGLKGASVASMHPAQSFSRKDSPPGCFEGITFGLEGEKKAVALAGRIVRQLGGRPLILRSEDKVFYHAACCFASNFLVALLDMSTSLLGHIGIREKEALKILFPLVEGTLRNVGSLNVSDSLTGPLARGDIESVEKHLESLQGFPQILDVYKKLGVRTLEVAGRERVSPRKFRALKRRLEGK